jgi:hypothetical protein
MKLFSHVLAGIFGVLCIASCSLNHRRQTSLMHGKVRGGDVPLYVMGGVSDFAQAGIFTPREHKYLRTDYEVLDMAANGKLTPALENPKRKVDPVAQLAIPLLVSTYAMPNGYEIRYALAATDELRSPSSLLYHLDESASSAAVAMEPDRFAEGE